MIEATGSNHMLAALAAKKKMASAFRARGIVIALVSGLTYGLYTAFMTLGMSLGVWADWYGPNTSGLSAFVVTYLLGALGAGMNDGFSALWAFTTGAFRGRAGDFFRTLKTKPGMVMVVAAVIGGPIASTAYVVAIQMAGSIVIPIAALCPAIGAILGRVLFKQELTSRMMLGIVICFSGALMIASTSLGGDAPEGLALGIVIGFLAALGWGFEGAVCGYGTSMIDSEIGITIRQVTSGLSNLIILLPLFGLIAGSMDISFNLLGQALTDPSAKWFIVSGLFAYISFMTWYKGNAMCGAPLGMSCNGTFSFWGPFCCWLVLGVWFGMDGWALPPIAWAAAVIMVVGIFTIAMNPFDLFTNKENA